MKKHLFLKSLLVAIGLLVTNLTTQLWADWFLPANIHYAAWSNNNNPMTTGDKKYIVFYAVPAGTYYFSLSNGSSTSGDCIQSTYGNITDHGYQTQEQAGSNTRRNWITTDRLCDIWFEVKNESTWKIDVSTTDPSVMIKYPWNDGKTWKWSNSMSSNGDGTYACVGQYGGTSYNKIKKTQNHDTGDEATATIDGTTPSNGEMCVFTYTVSTGALSIRKCNNITPTNYIFFDNSASSLTRTHKYFVMGRPVNASTATSKTYELGPVENTKLWLHTSTTDTWTDANYFAVLGSDDYFSNGNWYHDNIKVASEYSAPYLTHYNMESGHNYIVSKTDATNGTPISINEKGTTASSLNSTQTIKYAVSRNNGAYAELTSGVTPAQISISAYKFNDGTYDKVSNTSNSQTISANQSTTYSNSVDAAYTGETTLSYTSLQTGYSFIGWYDAVTEGNEISSTYYPTEAKVIYARFRENTYSVSFTNDGHGTVILPTSTPQTVGQLTGIAINAENSTGYHFNNWTSTSGGSFTSATTAGTNFYPTAATTVTANFAPNPYTITLNNQDATIAGSASIAVTFDATTNLTGTPAITVPEKTGYTFGGYYTETNGSGVQIIDANGQVIASASGGGNTYTSSTKQWQYAGDIELYAKWTADPLVLTTAGNWSNPSNWSPACVPTKDHDVTISAAVTVNTTNAVAKSINITTGSITINADAKLVVEQSITKNSGATTEEDIFIASSSSSNGTLIWGTTGTPGKATVAYYTKSHGTGTTDDVNQYIGTPFSDEYNNYNYYGAWVFKAKSDMSAWERLPMGTKMEPFVGYNVIYNSESAGHTFIMGGTLNSNGNVTCTCSSNNYGNENLLANSWVAPIDISKFVAGDFSGVTAAIYIFNSTSENASDESLLPTGGNYSTFNLATSGTIPSMQSFSVCGSGTVTLNYNRLVKGAGSVNNGPMHAPSRDIRAEMVSLTIHVNDENGWGDELKMFEHEDFSMDYENGWDAPKLMGYPQAPQMYAVCPEGNMAINSVPTFDNNVVAFQAGSASNEYTMSFAYDGEETLYLNDTKAAVSKEITEDKTYDFTAASGDNVARFTITKSPVYKVPTGMENTEGFTNSASKLMIDGTLYIIRDGRIYNAEGSLVK